MSRFVERNMEGILQEWEEHARTMRPAAAGMSREALRDFAEAILRAVAEDMRGTQSEEARHRKSWGQGPSGEPEELSGTARGHAAERLTEGFTLNQLVAEYRALRASVIRRWRRESEVSTTSLEELTRFNEAIDESLTEAVAWYNARIEDARDLLNGVLAHDLRSPLGAITTSADLLLRDESLDAHQMRVVVRVRNSAARLQAVISDLLDFTRTRLGTGLPMAPTRCSMKTILGDVVEEQRASHPEASIRCQATGRLVGYWDPARIQQMLANLIGNAVEHGGEAPVIVSAEGRDGEVTVEVHNERGAIPEEQQRVIFDPLRRAAAHHDDARDTAAGLGLGLYIARQVAEAHGGIIEVDSSAQAGTTFVVRLPRQPEEAAETAGLT